VRDDLVDVIFAAMRNQPATVEDRWRAVMRAGKIAEAYRYENPELLVPLFGANLLHNDGESNASLVGDGTH